MIIRLSSLLLLLLAAHTASADTVADIARAQAVLNHINKIVEKYRMLNVELEAPEPTADANGKFLLPYNASGEMTEWASKALTAQIGAAVGEEAGGMAGKALTSKVPLGGLMSGAIKKKGKQIGAVASLGGQKFLSETSDQSFANMDDYIVYLHVACADRPDYQEALASAFAVYPELEKRFDATIKNAYKRAAKKQKKA